MVGFSIAGSVALGILIVLLLSRKHFKTFKILTKDLEIIMALIVGVSISGIASNFLHTTGVRAAQTLNSQSVKLFGFGIMLVAAIVLFGIVLVHLWWKHKPEKWSWIAAFFAPTAGYVGLNGTLLAVANSTTGGVSHAFASFLASI